MHNPPTLNTSTPHELRKLTCMYVCMCVKHPNRCKTCTLIYLSSRGVVGILGVNPQRRHSKFAVICNLDADCTYLRSLLQPAKLRTGKTICFSTSFLDCWRNLNFNEDHVRILLMGSLCTDEGDKFGFHSSLLAQLKTVVLEFHLYLFISSWIRR